MTIPALRAIYLEDFDKDRDTYFPHLNAILKGVFEQVDIQHVRTISELRKKILERPHIAFCDNDLGGKQKNGGLLAIAELADKHEDTLFLLVTSHVVNIDNLGAYVPNPEIIVSKEYLKSQEYQHHLINRISSKLARLPLGKVELDFDLKNDGPTHGSRRTLQHVELHSLVEQCLHQKNSGKYISPVNSVNLNLVKGGFSGSGVYAFRPTRSDGKQNIPAILKVSDLKRAQQEFQNYLQFVKWRLPYTWRVDVLGTGASTDFGAICYSFAMGGGGDPTPVNQFIREGRVDVVDKVINSILHSKNQTWYSETRSPKRDASDYFLDKPFYSNNKRRLEAQTYFIEFLTEYSNAQSLEFSVNDGDAKFNEMKFRLPNALISGQTWGEVEECVCHGDLNGNNILYSGNGDIVVFIDFQNTGYWYQFRDFISFESSVRLEYPTPAKDLTPKALDELITMELDSLNRQWELSALDRDYVDAISKVRNAAHANFPAQKFSVYVVANIVHSLWLLQKASTWGHNKELRLAASIIAGCIFLASSTK